MMNRKAARRARRARRMILTVALMALVAVVSIGATVAYLTAKTETITNTFTTAGITLALDETKPLDLKMIPGKTLKKDPTVTASADVDYYVFVKLTKANWIAELSYDIAEGWDTLSDVNGETVIYKKLTAGTALTAEKVIKNNEVKVSDKLATMPTAQPTLTLKAYACQADETNNDPFTPAEAWDLVKNLE